MKKFLLLLLTFVTYSCSDDSGINNTPPPQNTDQLLPLAVGNEWVYRLDNGNETTVKIVSIKNLHWITADGISLDTLPTYITTGDNHYAIDANGNVLYGGFMSENEYVLKISTIFKNPGDNQVETGVETHTWTKTSTLTVPAGTFDESWRTSRDDGWLQTWYVKGVGMIQRQQLNSGSHSGSIVLVRYTLK